MSIKRIIVIVFISFIISSFFYIFLKPIRNQTICMGSCHQRYDKVYQEYSINDIIDLLNDNKVIKDIKSSKNITIVLNTSHFIVESIPYSYIYDYINDYEYLFSFMRKLSSKEMQIYLGYTNSKYIERKLILLCNYYNIKCFVN